MSRLALVEAFDLEVIQTYEGRQYITPDGQQYPSVTTVLGKQPKPELDAWRERTGEQEASRQTKTSAGIGNVLHSLCENHLLGKTLPPAMFSPRIMFNALLPELMKIDPVRGVEVALWSDYLKIAGRVDCVGGYEGKVSIIDFKNSKQLKDITWIEDYFLQETIYAMMFMERYKIPVPQIVTMVATWDGSKQVFVEPTTKRLDKVVALMEEYNELWQ